MAISSCPRVTRIDVTMRASDGRVHLLSADAPLDPELTLELSPSRYGMPPLTGHPAVFSSLPPPAEVRLSFKGNDSAGGIAARVIAVAGHRYECPEPGCPWPHVSAAEAELRAHLLAHEMVRQAAR